MFQLAASAPTRKGQFALNIKWASPDDRDQARKLGITTQDAFKLAIMPSDVRPAEEIDNYLVGYRRFPFRADEMAPVFLVDSPVDNYRIYDLANIFRPVKAETSLQAPVAEVDPETSLGTYRARPYALGAFIPRMTKAVAKNIDPEVLAARRIGDALGLERERRVLSVATTLGNWATTARATLTSDFRWNGGASSDPILDIMNRIEASTQPITDIYLGHRTVHAMLRNAKVVDYLGSLTGGGPKPTEIIRAMGASPSGQTIDFELPGLPTFHVVSSKQLNDTTGVLDELIGNHVVLVANPAGNSEFEDIRTFQTFRVRGPSGTGYESRTFADEKRGYTGGDMLVSGYMEVVVMITNSAGGFIQNAWQTPP